jgi:hypothetical protein
MLRLQIEAGATIMTGQRRPKGVYGTLVYLATHPGWSIVIPVALTGLGVLGVYAYDYLFK